MAIYGLIVDNKVVNVAEWTKAPVVVGQLWVLMTGAAGIGHDYDPNSGQVVIPQPVRIRALIPLQVVLARVMALGLLTEASLALASDKDLQARFLALKEGIYADDSDARLFLKSIGADPDVVLA